MEAKVIYLIYDEGQDGTDGSFLVAVSSKELANRVNAHQGAMNIGPGRIQDIKMYDSFEELPKRIKDLVLRLEKQNKASDDLVKKLKENFSEEEIQKLKSRITLM